MISVIGGCRREILYGVPLQLILEHRERQRTRFQELLRKKTKMGDSSVSSDSDDERKGQDIWFLKYPKGSSVFLNCDPDSVTPTKVTIVIQNLAGEDTEAMTLTRGLCSQLAFSPVDVHDAGICIQADPNKPPLLLSFLNGKERDFFYDALSKVIKDLELPSPSSSSAGSQNDLSLSPHQENIRIPAGEQLEPIPSTSTNSTRNNESVTTTPLGIGPPPPKYSVTIATEPFNIVIQQQEESQSAPMTAAPESAQVPVQVVDTVVTTSTPPGYSLATPPQDQ